jgi:hypothetical protein
VCVCVCVFVRGWIWGWHSSQGVRHHMGEQQAEIFGFRLLVHSSEGTVDAFICVHYIGRFFASTAKPRRPPSVARSSKLDREAIASSLCPSRHRMFFHKHCHCCHGHWQTSMFFAGNDSKESFPAVSFESIVGFWLVPIVTIHLWK